jgi:tRNA(Ile)-lysidine synthase
MLAHHKDDKIESIMQRIASSHHGVSLSGMAPAAQLPECEGQYGIYESGSPVPFDPRAGSESWRYESGGISVIRPLLSFSKRQLIDTCISNGVSWHEDQSNHDPTFTQRNAVRELIKSANLPAALSEARLLELADRVTAEDHKCRIQRDQFLSRCTVDSFDLRSGKLRILIPPLEEVLSDEALHFSSAEKYQICYTVLRFLVDLVSPKESINTRTFVTAVSQVFREFPELSNPNQKSDFTIAGVRIRQLPFSNRVSKLAAESRWSSVDHGPHHIWEFAREKPKSGHGPVAIYYSPLLSERSSATGSNEANLATSEVQSHHEVATPNSTGFALWDGRYWVRIESRVALEVVPLDMRDFRKFEKACRPSTDGPRDSSQARRLKSVDMGDVGSAIREYSNPGAIPAIILPREAECEERGMIVALPTFGLVHPAYQDSVRWTVYYKRVDVKPLALLSDPAEPYYLRSQV